MKPHQLGGARHQRCIAVGEARRMRLAIETDAKRHGNRYFFAHLETSRRERLRAPQPASARRGIVNISRTTRQHNNFSRKTALIFPGYAENDRVYAGFSDTRAQLANTGQSVCWHRARSSM